jgi:hypothetical protein
MQFLNSISNIIVWLQSPNFKSSHVYDANDANDANDADDDVTSDEDDVMIDDECPCDNNLNCNCDEVCNCGCEHCECEVPSDDENQSEESQEDQSEESQEDQSEESQEDQSEESQEENQEENQQDTINQCGFCECDESKPCDHIHCPHHREYTFGCHQTEQEYNDYLDENLEAQIRDYAVSIEDVRKGFNMFDENGQPITVPVEKSNYWVLTKPNYESPCEVDQEFEYIKPIREAYSSHPNGIVTCLKNLGYYSINVPREQIASQWEQLKYKMNYDTILEHPTIDIENMTLSELFSRYDIEPDLKTINHKVERAFQLSKFIGTDDWDNFVNNLTDDECEKILDVHETEYFERLHKSMYPPDSQIGYPPDSQIGYPPEE